MSVVQTTLGGGETDAERERPDTFRYCQHCEAYVLRTRWGPHEEHDWRARRGGGGEDGDGDGDDEDEPERVGAWYDITLSYTVDYRFRIPAWSKHEAEEVAKDLTYDATPADRYHVHTRTDERDEIFSDDHRLPEDFDVYGGTRLFTAIQEADEEGSA